MATNPKCSVYEMRPIVYRLLWQGSWGWHQCVDSFCPAGCLQPTPATCQATMMSLALSARMENTELMKV